MNWWTTASRGKIVYMHNSTQHTKVTNNACVCRIEGGGICHSEPEEPLSCSASAETPSRSAFTG